MAEQSGDDVLVARVQRGDRRAYDALVLRYQQRLMKLIMRYVHDPVEAQDVAQEAFIKAYRALPGFRGDSAFYTWLYRIAINTAKNHLAAVQRRPVSLDADSREAGSQELGDRLRDDASPERLALRDELGDTVVAAIGALPDELRNAIMLREIDGLSYEEIARAMDCPVGTVRSRIFRARDAIDKAIAALGDSAAGR